MLRQAQLDDRQQLLELHRAVAAVPGGIIRTLPEIDERYIENILSTSLTSGLILVVEEDRQLIGSIHAYTPELLAFRHLLTELTIVVHPQFQGRGHGRRLFTTFMEKVITELPHILRVELFVRSTNLPAIRFYTSLGFRREGEQTHKILNAEGMLETPVAMGWLRGYV